MLESRAVPRFRALDRAEIDLVLDRNHVGRIAYTFHDRVDIEPIHYVHEDGWIFGRTSPGSKIRTIVHHRWVAFEVDEVDALFDWRSVVAHGAIYLLENEGTRVEREAYANGLRLLRRIVPTALTPDDPTPERQVLFRIRVDEVTGRCAEGGTP